MFLIASPRPPLEPDVVAEFIWTEAIFSSVHLDRVIVVSGMHLAPRPKVAAALNQNV
jgi:hypothetical protein